MFDINSTYEVNIAMGMIIEIEVTKNFLQSVIGLRFYLGYHVHLWHIEIISVF